MTRLSRRIHPGTTRACYIAEALHLTRESPYHEHLRPKGIAFSTAVQVLKPVVEEKGILDICGFTEADAQLKVILDFFLALRSPYGALWPDSQQNVFRKASGFTGAVIFFARVLVPYCADTGDFRQEYMSSLLLKSPILPTDVHGDDGHRLNQRRATARIFELLRERCAIPMRELIL